MAKSKKAVSTDFVVGPGPAETFTETQVYPFSVETPEPTGKQPHNLAMDFSSTIADIETMIPLMDDLSARAAVYAREAVASLKCLQSALEKFKTKC